MKRARSDTDKEYRRLTLLEAALDCFYQSGFKSARMEDIARQAGVSKGTLYLYFDTKEALFHGIVREIAQPAYNGVQAVVKQAGSAREAIRLILSSAAQIATTSPIPKIIKVLVGDGLQFPQLVAEYRQAVIDQGLAMLTTLLEKAHERGELHVPQPDLTARLVVAPMIFSAIWNMVIEPEAKGRSFDTVELLKLHSEIILRGLSPERE